MTPTTTTHARRLGAAALAALLALPVGAMAQTATDSTQAAPAPAQAAPSPAVPGAPTHAANAAHGKKSESDVVERRIASLHSRLRITPAQEQQWGAFADVMRANAQEMDQSFASRSQQVQSMTAVQNMQSYAQMAQEHAQDVQKLVPAFQTLYDALSPDQKKVADQTFRSYAEHGAERHGRG